MSFSPSKDDRLWTTITVNFKSIFLSISMNPKKIYNYIQIYLLLNQFGSYKVINERI